MTLADITNKIHEDAARKAAEISSRTDEALVALTEETSAAIDALQNEHAAQLAQTLSENEMRVKAGAEQDARLKVESARENAMHDVVHAALEELTKLDEKAYGSFLEKLISRLPKGLEGTLEVSKSRKDITVTLLKKAGYVITETTTTNTFESGFILHTKDAVFTVSDKQLIARALNAHEITVAQTLFGATK